MSSVFLICKIWIDGHENVQEYLNKQKWTREKEATASGGKLSLLTLLHLFYKLNKNAFFEANPLFFKITAYTKDLIYLIYTVFKGATLLMAHIVIGTYIGKSNSDITYYYLSQLFLILFGTVVLSNQAMMNDRKVNSLKFLLSPSFSKNEISSNLNKLCFYYAFAMFLLVCFINSCVLPHYLYLGFWPILLSTLVTLLLVAYVFIKNRLHIQNEISGLSNQTKWYVQYLIAAFLAIVLGLNHKSLPIISSITFNEIKDLSQLTLTAAILMTMCHLLYLSIDLILNQRRESLDKRLMTGLDADYVENYIKYSAYWYLLFPALMRFVAISPISKSLVISIFLSFYATPNFCSLPILNYCKVISSAKERFLREYGKLLIKYLLIIQGVMSILAGLSLRDLLIGLLIGLILLFVRVYTATLILRLRVSDMRKADLYAIVVFLVLFLMTSIAFSLK